MTQLAERIAPPKRSPKTNARPKCLWCKKKFDKTRSDHVFCSGDCRRVACERRKRETEKALVAYFAPRGVPAAWLRDYVDLHLDCAKRILVGVGLAYDEQRRLWARA